MWVPQKHRSLESFEELALPRGRPLVSRCTQIADFELEGDFTSNRRITIRLFYIAHRGESKENYGRVVAHPEKQDC
jgi:hypothetical protein